MTLTARPVRLVTSLVLATLLFGMLGPVAAAAAATVGTTYVVTKVADTNDGACTAADCSLREALTSSNAAADTDTITFAIGTGHQQIVLASMLPMIQNPVVIDGTTQPGYDGKPIIELSGAGSINIGLWIYNTVGTVVRGLVINGVGRGILIEYGSGNRAEGNYLGTDVAGQNAVAGFSYGAIEIRNSSGNVVGGDSAASRNLISGAGFGVLIQSTSTTGNVVKNNYMGTTADGAAKIAVPSGVGAPQVRVWVAGGATNTVVDSNVIVGHLGNSVSIDTPASATRVVRNKVSTNAAGTAALPGSGRGISIGGSSDNVIGGPEAADGNVIANGVSLSSSATRNVVRFNSIGTDAAGDVDLNAAATAGVEVLSANGNTVQQNRIAFNGVGVRVLNGTGNTITANRIRANDGLGIDLSDNATVNANDAGDGDTGPNNGQNFPVLTSVSATDAATKVAGTLDTTAGRGIRLEFFDNGACDASQHGEGAAFLGSHDVTADGAGQVSFSTTLPTAAAGDVTATATDLTTGDTSEFSACMAAVVAADPPTAHADRLLFSSSVGGNRDIYTIKPDGTGRTRVTTAPGEELYATWSPDGTKIAYVGNDSLRIVNADGSGEAHAIHTGFSVSDPDWSPDGTRIAFSSFNGASTSGGSGYDVSVIQTNGTGLVNLTSHMTRADGAAGSEGDPRWSPDGSTLAFLGVAGSTRHVFLLDVTDPAAAPQQLTTGDSPSKHRLQWLPHGRAVTYSASSGPLHAVNIADGSVTPYDFGVGSSGYSWSHDAAQVAYAGAVSGLFVRTLSPLSQTDIAPGETVFYPEWLAPVDAGGAVNTAPVAVGDTFSTQEDTALTVAAPGVLGNDTDVDHDVLQATVVDGATNGTVTLDPEGGFVYTPASAFVGDDTFTYRASDGTDTSNLATVTVSVTAAPDPDPDAGSGVPTGTVYYVRNLLEGLKGFGVAWDGQPYRLTATPAGVQEQSVTVSPDGTKAAMILWDEGDVGSATYRFAVFEIGAAEPMWSRSVGDYSIGLRWSPDGESLALVPTHHTGERMDLQVMPADGSAAPRTVLTADSIYRFGWSPDSQTLGALITDKTQDSLTSIVTVDVASSVVSMVDTNTRITQSGSDLSGFAWSADGESIVFTQWTPNSTTRLGRAFPGGGTAVDLGVTDLISYVPQMVGDWLIGRARGHSTVVYTNVETGEMVSRDGSNEWDVTDWKRPAAGASIGPSVVVTTTTDNATDPGCSAAPGDCTLREAIEHTNNTDTTTGTAVIDLPDDVGPIKPTSPLPTITRPTILIGGGTLDDMLSGTTSLDGLGMGSQDDCASGPVVIDGSDAGADASGIRIKTGLDATRTTRLHRVAITKFGGHGIHIAGSRHVRVGCSSSTYNGRAGIAAHDAVDVTAVGEIALAANGGDGLRVTGASRRVRTWAGMIEWNGGLAVDLGDDGVTANDTGDVDSGPNSLVNKPSLVRVADDPAEDDPTRLLAVVRVRHNVSSGPFRLDLYRGATCDPSKHGEMYGWLAGARADLRTSAARLVRIRFRDGGTGPLSATVTSGAGTSEASRCLQRGIDSEPLTDEAVTDPATTVWPKPGPSGPTGSIGGPKPGDPPGGAGPGGNWGGDVPSDGVTDDTGTPGGDEPVGDGGGGTGGGGVDTPFDVGSQTVLGEVGKVTIDPPPGVFDDVTGGVAPYRAVKGAEGNMPADKWSLDATTGAVTLDATGLAAGAYFGSFTVTDARGATTPTRPVIFVVQDLSEKPQQPVTARPDRVVVEPGTVRNFAGKRSVLVNDSYHKPLSAVRVLGGTMAPARVTLNGDGTFSVDARSMAEGSYTFLYDAVAPDGKKDRATVTIVVDNFNTCATAVNDTWSVISGEVFNIPAAQGVLANDVDPEEAPLTARLVGTFARTDIALRTDGSVYLDARGAVPGTYRSFKYEALDPEREVCGRATVRLNIVPNQPPVANRNFFKVAAGRTFTLPARGVLGNDIDPDGPELGLTAKNASPLLAGLSLKANGALTYAAPAKAGRYVARYKARDMFGGLSAPAEIVFRVVAPALAPPPNRAPVAKDDLFYRVHADEDLVVTAAHGVLVNDRDPDGHALFAEPVGAATRTRFPLLRSGAFTFEPTLADIGKTLSYKYRAVEKGYSAAMSNAVTVSIKVMPPRERCRTAEATVDTNMYDGDGALDTVMASASGEFGWCHNLRRITRAGLIGATGGFKAGALTSRGRTTGNIDVEAEKVTQEALMFMHAQGLGVDRGSVTMYTGNQAAQVLMRPEYRMCVRPSDLIKQLATELLPLTRASKILKEPLAPHAGRFPQILQRMGALSDDEVLQGMEDSALKTFFGNVGGGLLAELADKELSFLFSKILERLAGADVTILVDGRETTVTGWEAVLLLVNAEDLAELGVKISETLDCIPLEGLGYDDAFALYYVQLKPSNSYAVQGEPSAADGFFNPIARWIRFLDLFNQKDVEVKWTGDFAAGLIRYIGCDYTRTRPSQPAVAPPQMPGDPPKTC